MEGFSCKVVGYTGETARAGRIAFLLRRFSCKVVGYTGETPGAANRREQAECFSCKVVGYTGETVREQGAFVVMLFQLQGSWLYW